MKTRPLAAVSIIVVACLLFAIPGTPAPAYARPLHVAEPSGWTPVAGLQNISTQPPILWRELYLPVSPPNAPAALAGAQIESRVDAPQSGRDAATRSMPLPITLAGQADRYLLGRATTPSAVMVSAAYYTPTTKMVYPPPVGTGGGTYVFTDTLTVPATITLMLPNGTVAQTTTLAYAPAETGTIASFYIGNRYFNLGAYQNDLPVPNFPFGRPVAVTIDYADADVAGFSEDNLRLYIWDTTSNAWQDAANTCVPPGNYLRYPGFNRLTVAICRLSQYPGALANFVGSPTSGLSPLTVVFTNTSSGDFTDSLWDFGDGFTSTLHSPTHTFTTGVYTVALQVSGPNASDRLTRTHYITAYEQVVADFVGSPTSGQRPLSVVFTNTSTGSYDTSAWNFGDGGTSNATHPIYTYTAAGVYTVSLQVSGPGGIDAITRTNYITVEAVPVAADFTASPTSGQRPLTVVFTNTSTGDYDNSQWNFGDGGTSSDTHPVHVYTLAGVYTVSLQISGPGGSDALTRTDYITVTAIPVTASFTGTPRSGVSPLSVVFTNTSTGDYDTSQWDFGDGGISTDVNPTHAYTVPGVYTVSLQVSGPGGSDAVTQTNFITVYTPVTADFTASPTSGQRPLTVVFTNTSTGDFNSSQWSFGDGGTSTTTDPVYSYIWAGVYTVSLRVSGNGGSDALTRTNYITVTAIPVSADFDAAPTSGQRPLTVVFTNTSTGDYTDSVWDFGDGITDTTTHPTHQYGAAGVYTVSLFVSGPGGSDALTRTDYITVTAIPVLADFVGAPTSGVAPLSVVFTNTSSGDYDTSQWDFGDSITSAVTHPTHQYTTPGVYTVSLQVSGPGGSDTLTRSNYITVYAQVAADFTANPTSGQRPLGVVFTNTSTGDFTSSQWYFGDGGTSNDTHPTYTYTAAGVYTVSLRVSGPGGSDALTRTNYITVGAIPVTVDFEGTPTSGPRPLSVNFTNNSTGDYSSSQWDFGDGAGSNATHPTHVYNVAGVYTVSLYVSGAGGSGNLTRTNYITVTPATVAANFFGTPTTGTVPLTVVFSNTSSGDYTDSQWDFGTGVTSTTTHPTHVYTAPGAFTVTLTVSGPGGTDTLTRVAYINVLSGVVQAIVDPTYGGTIAFTSATGSNVRVVVPTGAVTQPVTLTFTPVATTSTPPGYVFVGQAFTLVASQGGVPLDGFAFLRPVLVELNYTDADVVGLNENTLVLNYWDSATASWRDAATSCTPTSSYWRYPGQNKVIVGICHLSEFSFFANTGSQLYMPLILAED